MADTGTSCPANWTLHEEPVRSCGRKSDERYTCDAVLIPVTMKYSIVCGRILAYQRGDSYAFDYSVDWIHIVLGVNASIDSSYVDGLSLTHGLVGQRKHVWTFAGAWDETRTGYYTFNKITGFKYVNNNTVLTSYSCPCINPALTWPYEVPSYVGNSYFCDTGAHTFTYDYNKVYMDDPLWDGEGCGGSSTCCSLNSPPWFCQHLKYYTSDDLELRLCAYNYRDIEDKLISLVEIYVK